MSVSNPRTSLVIVAGLPVDPVNALLDEPGTAAVHHDLRQLARRCGPDPRSGLGGQPAGFGAVAGEEPDAVSPERRAMAALLTDAELAQGWDTWRQLLDPFGSTAGFDSITGTDRP